MTADFVRVSPWGPRVQEVMAGGFLWDQEAPVFTSPTGTAKKGGDDTEDDSEDGRPPDEDEGLQGTMYARFRTHCNGIYDV